MDDALSDRRPAGAPGGGAALVRGPAAGDRSRVRVRLVRDELPESASVARLLRRSGFDVTPVTDAEEALGLAREAGVDVAVLDLHEPDGRTGLAVLRALRAHHAGIAGVVFAGVFERAVGPSQPGGGADGSDGPLVDPAALHLPFQDFKEEVLRTHVAAYVTRLLDATGGNVAEAARRAGMHAPNFRRLMKRFDVAAAPEGRG